MKPVDPRHRWLGQRRPALQGEITRAAGAAVAGQRALQAKLAAVLKQLMDGEREWDKRSCGIREGDAE